jgi:hypothetical protein
VECVPNSAKAAGWRSSPNVDPSAPCRRGRPRSEQRRDHNAPSHVRRPPRRTSRPRSRPSPRRQAIDPERAPGQHPRIGRTDPCPHPAARGHDGRRVAIANAWANAWARVDLSIPVYLDESAATPGPTGRTSPFAQGEIRWAKDAIPTDPTRPGLRPAALGPAADRDIGARLSSWPSPSTSTR